MEYPDGFRHPPTGPYVPLYRPDLVDLSPALNMLHEAGIEFAFPCEYPPEGEEEWEITFFPGFPGLRRQEPREPSDSREHPADTCGARPGRKRRRPRRRS